MTSPLLTLAMACVRAWTRLYVYGLPSAARESRIAEIESDLWEGQHEAGRDGWQCSAGHLLARLVFGIPDDLGWRLEHAWGTGVSTERRVLLAARVAGAVLLVVVSWIIALDLDRPRPRSTSLLAAPASAITQEIETLMAGATGGPIPAGSLPLLTAGVAAAIGIYMQSPPDPRRQALRPPGGGRLDFRDAVVASSPSTGSRVTMRLEAGYRFTATNVSLGMLVQEAYQRSSFEIVGGPDWMDTARFNVAATSQLGTSPEHLRVMLRHLLEDHFRLAVHLQTRDLPVYRLVRAPYQDPRGSSLRPAMVDCDAVPVLLLQGASDQMPRCGLFDLSPNGEGLAIRGLTTAELASALKPIVGRHVIDQTGLGGYVDGDVTLSGKAGPLWPPANITELSPLFTAFEDQLGLRLEADRALVTVLVVERAERPGPV